MSENNCTHSAELALGILDGRQRAELMAHVDTCDSCRAEMRELAQVREELLALVPASEPPLGFESRVLQSLGHTKRHRRPWLRPLAAAVALLIALATGWFLAPRTEDSVVSADLTADGRTVGKAFLYTHSPAWIYMTVNKPGPSEEINCQLQRTDGTWVTTGWFSLTSGHGYWGGPAAVGSTAVRLLHWDGTLLATATL
jgi:hypothetical protein